MVLQITSTNRRRSAFTLVEFMVTSAVALILMAALMSLLFFSSRSFASITNYLDIDRQTQAALDKLSRDIRQVNKLTAYSATALTFEDWDFATLRYVYDPVAQTLTSVKGTNSQVLLVGCDSLQFSIFQRSPTANTFQPVSTASAASTKVIELTWNCSSKILGAKANTESMQSAKVVMRNK
jgi:prepilin-type N-terminal cleavage/methylation domain-containing protein